MYRDLHKIVLFLLLAGLFSSCARSVSPGGSGSIYQDDLSKSRQRYPFNDADLLIAEAPSEKTVEGTTAPEAARNEKTLTVNTELSEIIQTIHQQNKSVRYMPGFRIQLYVGNIRSEADAAKAFVYRSFPDLSPYVTFSQPTYRVKAGDFMTKAEAEQVLATMRLQYTSAMIVPDKIEIEKGLLQAIADR